MTNTAVGAGMGTAGLVGQFATIDAMGAAVSPAYLYGSILMLHFLFPALLSYRLLL
jgi:uncharacterized membrane protein